MYSPFLCWYLQWDNSKQVKGPVVHRPSLHCRATLGKPKKHQEKEINFKLFLLKITTSVQLFNEKIDKVVSNIVIVKIELN